MAYDSFCKFIGYIKNITRKYKDTQDSGCLELLEECLTYCGYSREEIERVLRIKSKDRWKIFLNLIDVTRVFVDFALNKENMN